MLLNTYQALIVSQGLAMIGNLLRVPTTESTTY